jgi:polyphenol oxidase
MAAFLTSPALDRFPWLFHGFGTRAFQENDLDAECAARGAKPVFLHQVHSARVLVLNAAPAVRLEADAFVTNRIGLALVIKTADCLPLFLVDPAGRAVAAVHAGWRGTAKEIVREAVGAMKREFHSEPALLLAVLGPCIGAACYEVGQDVVAAFSPAGDSGKWFAPLAGRPGKFRLDLRAANRAQLEAAGVPAPAIHDLGICTHCDPDLLSYRRDRRGGLRLFNFIGLRSG